MNAPTSRAPILIQLQRRHVLPAQSHGFSPFLPAPGLPLLPLFHSTLPTPMLPCSNCIAVTLLPHHTSTLSYSFIVDTQAALASLHCEVPIISDVLH